MWLLCCCVGVSQVQARKTSSLAQTATFCFLSVLVSFSLLKIKWHIYEKMNNVKRFSRDTAVLTKGLKTDQRYICGEGNSLEVLEALACLPAPRFPARHRAEEFLNMPARVQGVYRKTSCANVITKMRPHF